MPRVETRRPKNLSSNIVLSMNQGGIGDVLALRLLINSLKNCYPNRAIQIILPSHLHHYIKTSNSVDNVINPRLLKRNNPFKVVTHLPPIEKIPKGKILLEFWGDLCNIRVENNFNSIPLSESIWKLAYRDLRRIAPKYEKIIGLGLVGSNSRKSLSIESINKIARFIRERGYVPLFLHSQKLKRVECEQYVAPNFLTWAAIIDLLDGIITVPTAHMWFSILLNKKCLVIDPLNETPGLKRYAPKMSNWVIEEGTRPLELNEKVIEKYIGRFLEEQPDSLIKYTNKVGVRIQGLLGDSIKAAQVIEALPTETKATVLLSYMDESKHHLVRELFANLSNQGKIDSVISSSYLGNSNIRPQEIEALKSLGCSRVYDCNVFSPIFDTYDRTIPQLGLNRIKTIKGRVCLLRYSGFHGHYPGRNVGYDFWGQLEKYLLEKGWDPEILGLDDALPNDYSLPDYRGLLTPLQTLERVHGAELVISVATFVPVFSCHHVPTIVISDPNDIENLEKIWYKDGEAEILDSTSKDLLLLAKKAIDQPRIRTKDPISIILTAYKTANFLEETLDSIENQTYFSGNNNYEILLGIDNCIETLRKVQEIMHKYRNLKIYFFNKRVGTYVVSNTLLDRSVSNLFLRFDTDDIMKPHMVDTLIKTINRGKDLVWMEADSFVGDPSARVEDNAPLHGVCLYTREVCQKLGGYKPWVCAGDSDFLKRAGLAKLRVTKLNQSLFHRRIHSSSLTNDADTGYASSLRLDYRDCIVSRRFHQDRPLFEKPVKGDSVEIHRDTDIENLLPKNRFVFAISTFDRLNFLKRTVESWDRTRSRGISWVLIIADDGSQDGTLEYIRGLEIEGVQIHVIENYRLGVHGQTNSILRLCEKLDFDFGFKADDDLDFIKEGWDLEYYDCAMNTGFHHLCFNDIAWAKRRGVSISDHSPYPGLIGLVGPEDCQGAFWTFTRKVLEDVGYLDVLDFGPCGYGHVDFTARCVRLGFNDNPVLDIRGSNDYIQLIKEDYKGAPNVHRYTFNTKESVVKKKELIGDKTRGYIPYHTQFVNLELGPPFKYKYSFVIPLRGREDMIPGLVENLNKYALGCEIIFVQQADKMLFKRGQLCNLGYQKAKGEIIVFQDVDIRHNKTVNFEPDLDSCPPSSLGIIAFDAIRQVKETPEGFVEGEEAPRTRAWGGCTAFYKENFAKSFGFSNLIKGWGAEDNLLQVRTKMTRLHKTLLHVSHPSPPIDQTKSKLWYQTNVNNYLSEPSRDPSLDGYHQTKANIEMFRNDNIVSLICSNIGVPDAFKNSHLLYKEGPEDQDKEASVIPHNKLFQLSKQPPEYNPKIEPRVPISIIVTAYETEDFIEEALLSIENQTYFKENNEYEILLGIDSCEATLQRAQEIKGRIRNLRVFMMDQNVGTYVTSNTLLGLCKYNHILRFDSDDIMEIFMIEELLKYKDCNLVRFFFETFSDNPLVCVEPRHNRPASGVCLYDRKLLNTLGGYRPWVCAADTDFHNRAEAAGMRTYVIKKHLFRRRVHPQSLTSRPSTNLETDLRKKYKDFYTNKSNYVPSMIFVKPEISSFKEI